MNKLHINVDKTALFIFCSFVVLRCTIYPHIVKDQYFRIANDHTLLLYRLLYRLLYLLLLDDVHRPARRLRDIFRRARVSATLQKEKAIV